MRSARSALVPNAPGARARQPRPSLACNRRGPASRRRLDAGTVKGFPEACQALSRGRHRRRPADDAKSAMTKSQQLLRHLAAPAEVVWHDRIAMPVMPADKDRPPAPRLERHQLVCDRGREIARFDAAARDHQSLHPAGPEMGNGRELALEVTM